MEQPSIWNGKVYFLLLLLLNCMFSGIISVPESRFLIRDVTYDELKELGATCQMYDNCKLDRENDFLFASYTCNCDRSCVVFDTCCVDSVFRKSESPFTQRPNLKCLQVYGDSVSYVYMVDSCKPNYPKDLVADLCLGDGESRNDPLLLIPATSQLTGITYKNQFCSICNNDTEATTLWDLKVIYNTSEVMNSTSVPSLKYSNSLKTWKTVATSGNENSVTVYLSVLSPPHIYSMVKNCQLNLVSNCSREWTDVYMKQKCAAYMARVFIPRNGTVRPYRNPHCALCNFESLDNMFCVKGTGYDFVNNVLFVSLFSMDDKPKKCGKDEIYDKIADRCRVLKCPPDHSVEKGKCVANS